MRLVLASASPRRAELLTAAGFEFDIQTADIDERAHDDEAPEAYVRRMAETKADVVARQRPGRAVLAADTTVIIDGDILGKPVDAADARRMLERLSGRRHDVLTAVALVPAGPRTSPVPMTRVGCTTVQFAAMTTTELDWYVASGEPLDKAGAYGIQGRASRFITRIEGSYSNVVGLPVELVHEMLRRS